MPAHRRGAPAAAAPPPLLFHRRCLALIPSVHPVLITSLPATPRPPPPAPLFGAAWRAGIARPGEAAAVRRRLPHLHKQRTGEQQAGTQHTPAAINSSHQSPAQVHATHLRLALRPPAGVRCGAAPAVPPAQTPGRPAATGGTAHTGRQAAAGAAPPRCSRVMFAVWRGERGAWQG